uniref:Uncharacterized protein n=1 Tax=Octopus bimaculoides TaxID=37653 RepID=A0A0L8HE94_OCTBM
MCFLYVMRSQPIKTVCHSSSWHINQWCPLPKHCYTKTKQKTTLDFTIIIFLHQVHSCFILWSIINRYDSLPLSLVALPFGLFHLIIRHYMFIMQKITS